MRSNNLAPALGVTAILMCSLPAAAQTIVNYRCDDGLEFAVAFFDGDRSAHIQVDGKQIALPRRLAVSGSRYAKGDVTLSINRSLATIKRGKRLSKCSPS